MTSHSRSRSHLRHEPQAEPEQEIRLPVTGLAPTQGIAPTPEELLRQDRAAIQVPDPVTQRLAETLVSQPPPRRASWWRRLLGRQ